MKYEELEPYGFSDFFIFLEAEDWVKAGKALLFQARDGDSRLARDISLALLADDTPRSETLTWYLVYSIDYSLFNYDDKVTKKDLKRIRELVKSKPEIERISFDLLDDVNTKLKRKKYFKKNS